jgi:hypothetical protein
MENFIVGFVQVCGVGNMPEVEMACVGLDDVFLLRKIGQVVLKIQQLDVVVSTQVRHYGHPVAKLVDKIAGEVIHDQKSILHFLSTKNANVFGQTLAD